MGKTRGDDVSLGGCNGQTFSQSGHDDLTKENDTFTHRISHADLASGEWPRHSLSPISHVDLNRSGKTQGAPHTSLA